MFGGTGFNSCAGILFLHQTHAEYAEYHMKICMWRSVQAVDLWSEILSAKSLQRASFSVGIYFGPFCWASIETCLGIWEGVHSNINTHTNLYYFCQMRPSCAFGGLGIKVWKFGQSRTLAATKWNVLANIFPRDNTHPNTPLRSTHPDALGNWACAACLFGRPTMPCPSPLQPPPHWDTCQADGWPRYDRTVHASAHREFCTPQCTWKWNTTSKHFDDSCCLL